MTTDRKTITPEGFLLIEGVPVSRVGRQDYASYEVADVPAVNGRVTAVRNEDEVFAEESIKSFNGKSITIAHPSEFVNDDNHKFLEVGVALNARPSKDRKFVLADMLIKDKGTVEKYKAKGANTEVSVGYNNDWRIIGDGLAEQTNIRVNHIALVPRGRCGASCATQDHFTLIEDTPVQTQDDKTILDSIKGLLGLKANDAAPTKTTNDNVELIDSLDADRKAMKTEMEGMKSSCDAMKEMMDGFMKHMGFEGKKSEDGKLTFEKWAEQEKKEPEHSTDSKPDETPASTKVTADTLNSLFPSLAIVAPKMTKDHYTELNDECACKRLALKDALAGSHGSVIKGIVGDADKLTTDSLNIAFGAVEQIVKTLNDSALKAASSKSTDKTAESIEDRAGRLMMDAATYAEGLALLQTK